MNSLPLASILTLISSVITTACAITISKRQKIQLREGILLFKTGETYLVSRFFVCFIICATGLFIYGLPGVFVRDLKLVQASYALGDVIFLIAVAYLISIPYILFSQNKTAMIVTVRIFLAYAVFYFVYNLITLKEAMPVHYGSFIDWRSSINPAVQTVEGLFLVIGLLLFIALFVIKGWKHENSFIRRRSRFFAIGFSIVLVGWISVFVFLTSETKNISFMLSGGVIGNIFISSGFFIVLRGIIAKDN